MVPLGLLRQLLLLFRALVARHVPCNNAEYSLWALSRDTVMNRNIKRWFGYCWAPHIPLFEKRPSQIDYCGGCGTKVELRNIEEGYVSKEEADAALAQSVPRNTPDHKP
jgi:hypothetical protein